MFNIILTVLSVLATIIIAVFAIIRWKAEKPIIKIKAHFVNLVNQNGRIEIMIVNIGGKQIKIEHIYLRLGNRSVKKFDKKLLNSIQFQSAVQDINLPFNLAAHGESINLYIDIPDFVKYELTSKKSKFYIVIENPEGKQYKSKLLKAVGFFGIK